MTGIKVTVAAPEVALNAGVGSIAVTVTNDEPVPDRVMLAALPGAAPSAQPAPASCASVDRPQRDLAPGATEQYVVAVNTTALAGGTYALRLVAYSADKAPEDYSDLGTTVTFVVPVPEVAPKRKVPWWVFAAAAAVLVAVVIEVVYAVTRPEIVAVPGVVGATEAAAVSELEEARFTVTVEEEFAAAPLGVVLSQNPSAESEVELGSKITVVVSIGKPVGVLTDLTIDAARAQVGSDFLITTQDQPDQRPSGTVIAQVPQPGEVIGKGGSVVLTVSVQTAAVPDVRGRRVQEARDILVGAGFRVALQPGRCNPSLPPLFCVDLITFQRPAGGTLAPVGSEVTIFSGDL